MELAQLQFLNLWYVAKSSSVSLLVQISPSQVYPESQVHVNPGVMSAQEAVALQLSEPSAHSSMSTHEKKRPNSKQKKRCSVENI